MKKYIINLVFLFVFFTPSTSCLWKAGQRAWDDGHGHVPRERLAGQRRLGGVQRGGRVRASRPRDRHQRRRVKTHHKLKRQPVPHSHWLKSRVRRCCIITHACMVPWAEVKVGVQIKGTGSSSGAVAVLVVASTRRLYTLWVRACITYVCMCERKVGRSCKPTGAAEESDADDDNEEDSGRWAGASSSSASSATATL